MEEFLRSIRLGKYYIVERLIGKNPRYALEPEALRSAVLYNRTKMASLLLEYGASVTCMRNGMSMIVLACKKGYNKMTRILLGDNIHQRDKERAFLEAVKDNQVRCAITMIVHGGVNVSMEEDQALFEALANENKHMIRVLLNYGGNIDARQGELLIKACEGMSKDTSKALDMIEFLLKQEADVNIRESECLRMCVTKRYYRVVELLLEYGADDTVIDTVYQDYLMRNVITNWRRNNRCKRLRKAIRSSFDRDIWKWQSLCRENGSANETLVRQQAKSMGLHENLSCMNKREMCKMLAEVTEPLIKPNETLEGTDLFGDEISSIPKWKLYEVHGRVYNVFDLYRMIKNGYTTCPYTRLPIPVQDIKERCKYLERVLTRNRFRDFNLIEQVRELPLITKEMEIKTKLVNHLWCRLEYPPSINVILQSPISTIDDMLSKLYRVANDPFLYPMLSTYRKWEISHETNDNIKREKFVDLLIDITKVQDEDTSVRLNMLQILFQHYRDDGTNRLGEDDDLLTFMLEDDDQDDDGHDEIVHIPAAQEIHEQILVPLSNVGWLNGTRQPSPPVTTTNGNSDQANLAILAPRNSLNTRRLTRPDNGDEDDPTGPDTFMI